MQKNSKAWAQKRASKIRIQLMNKENNLKVDYFSLYKFITLKYFFFFIVYKIYMTTSRNQFKKQMSLYSRLSQNSSQALQIENLNFFKH